MSLHGDKLSIPNLFSYLRIVLIPVFIYFLAVKSWVLALIVFVVASFTDFLDGWFARILNQESEFGKFIDPIADKFLVISSLIAIIALDPSFHFFDSWMIVIIVGRDVLITVMRLIAIKKGRSLRTSRFGKFKTAFQMLSIVIILMIYMVRKSDFLDPYIMAPYWIMFSVTVLTALSGLRYLYSNWGLFFPEKDTEGTVNE